jgi:hypothetical protein
MQVMDCCYVCTDTQCATPGTCFKRLDDKCVVGACVKGKLSATRWRFRVIHYFIASLLGPYASPISRQYLEQLEFKSLLLVSFNLYFGHTAALYFRNFFGMYEYYNYYTYLFTDLLTLRRRVLLEKLTVSQLVNKFPAFYGTRRFISSFTSACHLSLPSARSTQSILLFLLL